MSRKLKHLEKVLTLIPGNVYWKNRQHIYEGCNKNNADWLRLPSNQDIVGKTIYDIAHKTTGDIVTRIDEEVMSSETEMSVEENLIDNLGHQAIFLTHKAPMYDEDGQVIGLVGVSLDITEQKRIEAELRLAKEKAELANKTKSEFIMNMSHDIRTPFSGIIGFSKMLESQETDPTKRDMLQAIVESSENLLDLLNDILDISDVEAGTVELHTSTFSLSKLVTMVSGLMSAEIRRKSLKLIINIDDDVPENIVSDKLRLHRVLLNLLNNAVKFTHEGHIEIHISCAEQTADKLVINFSIKDSGIGIPLDKHDVIFDRFSRLSASYYGQYQGVGLGLYMVKKFIEDLHGELHLDSEPGKGSTFDFSLPVGIVSQSDSYSFAVEEAVA